MKVLFRISQTFIFGFFILCFATPVNSQNVGLQDIKIPQVEHPKWKTGQSATYLLKISGIPAMKGIIAAKIRIAIVGSEKVVDTPVQRFGLPPFGNQEPYWLEIDISELKGFPPELEPPFKVLKVKLLMEFIPLKKFLDSPKAILKEVASGKALKKIIFQIDDLTPQMSDFMTFQSMIQNMTKQDLKKMIDKMPNEEVKFDSIITKQETITIPPVGTFNDAPCISFKVSYETYSGEGIIHLNSNIPFTGFVKLTMNIGKDIWQIPFNVELIAYEMIGAITQIVGEPVDFDLINFIGSEIETGIDNDLKVTDWKWVNESSLNCIRVEGVVKNKSSKYFKSVQIIIAARDGNGNFLGTATSFLQPSDLSPGDESIFTAYIDNAICTTDSIKISVRFDSFDF